jgi:hypothetical protein
VWLKTLEGVLPALDGGDDGVGGSGPAVHVTTEGTWSRVLEYSYRALAAGVGASAGSASDAQLGAALARADVAEGCDGAGAGAGANGTPGRSAAAAERGEGERAWGAELPPSDVIMATTAVPLFLTAQETVWRLMRRVPQASINGVCNVWVLKPGCGSRGVGVSLQYRLDAILRKRSSGRIVQKYVESPLLLASDGSVVVGGGRAATPVAVARPPPRDTSAAPSPSPSQWRQWMNRIPPPSVAMSPSPSLRGAGAALDSFPTASSRTHDHRNVVVDSVVPVVEPVVEPVVALPSPTDGATQRTAPLSVAAALQRFKFDIRQLVLVTSWSPLRVHIYDSFYLRFASHAFDMSVGGIGDKYAHICNYSVQKQNSAPIPVSVLTGERGGDGSGRGGSGSGHDKGGASRAGVAGEPGDGSGVGDDDAGYTWTDRELFSRSARSPCVACCCVPREYHVCIHDRDALLCAGCVPRSALQRVPTCSTTRS